MLSDILVLMKYVDKSFCNDFNVFKSIFALTAAILNALQVINERVHIGLYCFNLTRAIVLFHAKNLVCEQACKRLHAH